MHCSVSGWRHYSVLLIVTLILCHALTPTLSAPLRHHGVTTRSNTHNNNHLTKRSITTIAITTATDNSVPQCTKNPPGCSLPLELSVVYGSDTTKTEIKTHVVVEIAQLCEGGSVTEQLSYKLHVHTYEPTNLKPFISNERKFSVEKFPQEELADELVDDGDDSCSLGLLIQDIKNEGKLLTIDIQIHGNCTEGIRPMNWLEPRQVSVEIPHDNTCSLGEVYERVGVTPFFTCWLSYQDTRHAWLGYTTALPEASIRSGYLLEMWLLHPQKSLSVASTDVWGTSWTWSLDGVTLTFEAKDTDKVGLCQSVVTFTITAIVTENCDLEDMKTALLNKLVATSCPDCDAASLTKRFTFSSFSFDGKNCPTPLEAMVVVNNDATDSSSIPSYLLVSTIEEKLDSEGLTWILPEGVVGEVDSGALNLVDTNTLYYPRGSGDGGGGSVAAGILVPLFLLCTLGGMIYYLHRTDRLKNVKELLGSPTRFASHTSSLVQRLRPKNGSDNQETL